MSEQNIQKRTEKIWKSIFNHDFDTRCDLLHELINQEFVNPEEHEIAEREAERIVKQCLLESPTGTKDEHPEDYICSNCHSDYVHGNLEVHIGNGFHKLLICDTCWNSFRHGISPIQDRNLNMKFKFVYGYQEDVDKDRINFIVNITLLEWLKNPMQDVSLIGRSAMDVWWDGLDDEEQSTISKSDFDKLHQEVQKELDNRMKP
jgi:hypothetical protein